tara:strand:+ start:1652 stop:2053 length:402 start_codon:yes stop_codon:yes gene_type:complete
MKSENIKLPSNRSFGVVFFIVFLIIAIWPLKNGDEIRIIPIIISQLFLFLGLLNSDLLKPLNFLWMKFGLFLGKILNPVIMGVIYFLTVVPIGLIFKLLNKDLLSIKKDPKLKSYWIKKNLSEKNKSSMKNQF